LWSLAKLHRPNAIQQKLDAYEEKPFDIPVYSQKQAVPCFVAFLAESSVIRIDEARSIEVHFVKSAELPEPGIAATAAACGNAVRNVIGIRHRHAPAVFAPTDLVEMAVCPSWPGNLGDTTQQSRTLRPQHLATGEGPS
jgi:hypothetical protein